jgi:hypothetical protein
MHLVLRRGNASRISGSWQHEDYDVFDSLGSWNEAQSAALPRQPEICGVLWHFGAKNWRPGQERRIMPSMGQTQYSVRHEPDWTFAVEIRDPGKPVVPVAGFRTEKHAQDWILHQKGMDDADDKRRNK